MVLLLVLANIIAFLSLLATLIAGLAHHFGWAVHKETHILLGIFATVLVLFAHSTTIFYFIGTGSYVKKLFHEEAVAQSLWDRTRAFKKRLFPWILCGMVTIGATFILGGAVDTGHLPPLVHLGMALVAVVVNYVTVKQEIPLMAESIRVMKEAEASPEGSGEVGCGAENGNLHP